MKTREFEMLRLLRDVNESYWKLEDQSNGRRLSRHRLRWRLGKLTRNGWITQGAANRWILTPTGEEKVAALEDWEVIVERVDPFPERIRKEMRRTVSDAWRPFSDVRRPPSAMTRGDLRRGIPNDGDGYLIHRDGVLSGDGTVTHASCYEPADGGRSSVWLSTDGAIPISGDVLTHGSPNLSST
jgi:hypothetical protein